MKVNKENGHNINLQRQRQQEKSANIKEESVKSLPFEKNKETKGKIPNTEAKRKVDPNASASPISSISAACIRK